MNPDDRFSFLLSALLASAVILGASQMHRPPMPGISDPPRVGRSASEVAIGPMVAEDDAAEAPVDDLASRAARRVADLLRTHAWPGFARGVVFHPLPEAVLAPGDLEEGAPYQIVVAKDGSLSWTVRGESGSPSIPPGLSASNARDVVHVAILEARTEAPERAASVRALWSEAARNFGEGRVVFVDEVAESSMSLPSEFDRAAHIGGQDTRKPQTRSDSSPTRPTGGEGVRIRFGSGTVDAGLAMTSAARRDGLMGRTSLRPNEGLLFVYRTPDDRSFWMKGCLIPLDILYLSDDGIVLQVGTLQPPGPKTSDADLARLQSTSPTRLVLEVAAGSAVAHGVKRGTRLGLPESVSKLFPKADP
jgi:uncharacterized membrane protein (UPF0127 family)